MPFDEGETNVVLLTELLAEGSAHDHTTNAGRRGKVRLARLAPRGVNVCNRPDQQLKSFFSKFLRHRAAFSKSILTLGNHFVDWAVWSWGIGLDSERIERKQNFGSDLCGEN